MADQIIPAAASQYTDGKGCIAIDGHEGGVLHVLAEKYGINTKQYFPLHVSLDLSSDGNFSAVFYAADRDNQGYSFDDLSKLAKQDGNRLPVVKIEADIELSPVDLFKVIKRIEVQIRDANFPTDINLVPVGD